MKIYWSISEIPELAHLTPKVRKQVFIAAWWSAFGRWPMWVAAIVPIAVAKLVVAPLLGLYDDLAIGLGGGVYAALAYLVVVHDIRKEGGKPKPDR